MLFVHAMAAQRHLTPTPDDVRHVVGPSVATTLREARRDVNRHPEDADGTVGPAAYTSALKITQIREYGCTELVRRLVGGRRDCAALRFRQRMGHRSDPKPFISGESRVMTDGHDGRTWAAHPCRLPIRLRQDTSKRAENPERVFGGAAMGESEKSKQAEAPHHVQSAERAAVAKRGRRAAKTAAIAASDAVEAATESAEAAKGALVASTQAEASATKTDAAATLAGLSTLASFADAQAEMRVTATATAKAATSAVAASRLSETSAKKSAAAARLAGLATRAALADVEAEPVSREDEVAAHRRHGDELDPSR